MGRDPVESQPCEDDHNSIERQTGVPELSPDKSRVTVAPPSKGSVSIGPVVGAPHMALALGKRREQSRWALVSGKPGFKGLSPPLAVCVTLGKSNPQPQFPRSYNGNDCRIAS